MAEEVVVFYPSACVCVFSHLVSPGECDGCVGWRNFSSDIGVVFQ